jgi:hypothetical protein
MQDIKDPRPKQMKDQEYESSTELSHTPWARIQIFESGSVTE